MQETSSHNKEIETDLHTDKKTDRYGINREVKDNKCRIRIRWRERENKEIETDRGRNRQIQQKEFPNDSTTRALTK